MSTDHPPKAIFTDVFGTIVNWRLTVVTHLVEQASLSLNSASKSLASRVRLATDDVDWPSFAQEWRNSYYQYTRNYDPENPATPFRTIDQHHLEALKVLLEQHGLTGLWDDEELDKISKIWHYLEPWIDSSQGLQDLNDAGIITSTLSNGNTSLLKDLAATGNLPYTVITSAEEFKAYKPHHSVYLGAAKKLNLDPKECCLMAAHLNDIKAAHDCGFQTIYIERADEESWDRDAVERAKQASWVDMWVPFEQQGVIEAARRLKKA